MNQDEELKQQIQANDAGEARAELLGIIETLRAENERLESCFLEFETITDKGLYARVSDIVKVLDNVRAENEHLQNEMTEWKNVARMLADELAEANSKLLPVCWEDASESSPAWIAYCNLRDREEQK